jgi:hypothetical protein
MEPDVTHQLIIELEQLASDYPDEPEWRELLDKARRDCLVEQPTETAPSRPRLAVQREGQRCYVCEVTPAGSSAGLCEDCAAMYRSINANVIIGKCTCGHRPEGPQAYAYRRGSVEEAFCGLKCVREHFRKEYQLFLGGNT